MSLPPVVPSTPPEFHPEFGYFWPAAHTRRMVHVALMSTAFGVLFGAIAVLAMSTRTDSDIAAVDTALSAVPVEEPVTVGAAIAAPVEAAIPAVAATLPKQPAALAAKSCNEQTWPYVEGKCLNKSARKRQPVRVLKPEAPAQSAPAQVVPASTPEVTAAAKTVDLPKAAKKREKRAKSRQRGREFVDRDRGRYADPRSAYASPYVPRYEMAPRGWGW